MARRVRAPSSPSRMTSLSSNASPAAAKRSPARTTVFSLRPQSQTLPSWLQCLRAPQTRRDRFHLWMQSTCARERFGPSRAPKRRPRRSTRMRPRASRPSLMHCPRRCRASGAPTRAMAAQPSWSLKRCAIVILEARAALPPRAVARPGVVCASAGHHYCGARSR